MLEHSLFESTHALGARKPAAILASVGVQVAVLAGIALVPLLRYQLLPALESATQLDLPAPAAPAPAPAPAPIIRLTHLRSLPALLVPVVPTPGAVPPQSAPLSVPGPATLAPFAMGPVANLGALLPAANLPLPKPTPAPAAGPLPIAVGGAVQAARCLSCVPPIYPAVARQARIQGTVELQALIGADGGIEQLTRLSGNPVLAAAALRAVRAWRYQPLRLNGRALPVTTVITLRFHLEG